MQKQVIPCFRRFRVGHEDAIEKYDAKEKFNDGPLFRVKPAVPHSFRSPRKRVLKHFNK